MDLLTGWDFDKESDRKAAIKYVKEVKPWLVIGSPMCTMFSQLMNLNWNKSKERDDKMRDMLGRAIRHVEFMIVIYRMQIDGGRYFLHEHPLSATSWKLDEVRKLVAEPGVLTTTADQCEYGVKSKDEYGVGCAMKPTKFATNSVMIAERLSTRCQNKGRKPEERHRHVHLISGRARKAQEYPRELCLEIARGIKEQLRDDKEGVVRMMKIGKDENLVNGMSNVKLKSIVEELSKEAATAPVHDEDSNEEMAWDDVSGVQLDARKVREAREVEMEYFRKMKVYSKVPRLAGEKVIKTRWVDINKGDSKSPVMRSRLVAMDFKDCDRPELYAGTPPTEAMRMLCSIAASKSGDEKKCIMLNDVSRAYFYAKVRRPVWVELPEEDKTQEDREKGHVGRLHLSMYGTREAAQNWQEEVSDHLMTIGFKKGKANPCMYFHEKRDIASLVHGDDYVSTGVEENLRWLEAELAKKFAIKTTVAGHNAGLASEVKALNRIMRATPRGWEFEGDQRHGELIVEETGMKSAKGVSTAGEDDSKRKEDEPKMDERGRKWYRGLVARANYYSQDRPDMSFAVKEACRYMSEPNEGDERRAKRIGKYLREHPRLVQEFVWQDAQEELRVYTDSDWAGCERSRKSTSGGVLLRGAHCLKFWAKTQATIALSSAEAELISLVKGSCEALGAKSHLEDFGQRISSIGVYTDASAAIGIAQRAGVGRTRHIDVGALWVQQKVWQERLQVQKIAGKLNPADMFTKNVPKEVCVGHMSRLGFKHATGRSELANELATSVCRCMRERRPR